MRDYFQSDSEGVFDRQEGRRSKMDAKEALDRRMIKQTSGFGETFKRWRENKEKLVSYRAGTWKPEKKYEVDWGKVGYTATIQLINLLISAGCIFTGSWPFLLVSIPGLIALNFYFLIKDSRI